MFDKLLGWVEANYLKASAILLLALVLVVSLALAQVAKAANADLTWTYPATNTDGTAIPASGAGSIASSKIEWGSCEGTAFGVKAGEATVNAPTKAYSVTGLGVGTHCFRAAVVNSFGVQSDWTGPVQKVIAAPKPNPPVFTTVNIVAFDVRWQPGGGTKLARAVGTVPLGTACGESVITRRGLRAYHEVTLDKVDLRSLPNSAVVVAECEVQS